MKKTNIKKIKLNLFTIISFLFIMVLIIYRMFFISLSTIIDNKNIKEFAQNRDIRKSTIYAKRGNIYDRNGEILAQTVNSYTVIAYLSATRSENTKTLYHVKDKEGTAEKLSKIINMDKDRILTLLNQNVYQVELGPGGRDISETKKQQIEELKLPGIDFIKSYKRYYPNNDFLSYVLGYVQKTEGKLVGEMGIEEKYNDILEGTDGYVEYQQDVNGYKIPNTPEIRKEKEDGSDIYLTIDNNIQFFTESITKKYYEKYNPEWVLTTVMHAKTGEILSSTSYPSFDPNIKNITNYLNPLVSYAFEPGSIMKTYTFMHLMEIGKYNTTETFPTGKIHIYDSIVSDWDTKGWGRITFDLGFKLSANTGIAHMITKYIDRIELRNFYEKLGFGSKTGIELYGEKEGSLNFYYPIETINAGFGQKITTTPIQQMKALTSVANEGYVVDPYLVSKISKGNEVSYEKTEPTKTKVLSADTAKTMKDLLYEVVNSTGLATGGAFKTENINLIGKTGTAQYVNPKTNKYYSDNLSYIRSFVGMFPYENPEYIIHAVAKKPTGSSAILNNIVKDMVRDISNYQGLFDSKEEIALIHMPNLLNTNVKNLPKLKNKFIIIGNSDKIIKQYPNSGETITEKEKIFIYTNDNTISDLKKLSLREIKIVANLLNYELEYEGFGFVFEYETDNKKIYAKLKSDIGDE